MCCHVSSTNNGPYKNLKRRSAANSLQHIAYSAGHSLFNQLQQKRKRKQICRKTQAKFKDEITSIITVRELFRTFATFKARLLSHWSPPLKNKPSRQQYLFPMFANGEVEEEAAKVVLNFVIYLYMYALDKPYEILLSNCKDAEIYPSSTNYTYYLVHFSST